MCSTTDMASLVDSLPDDVETLRAMVLATLSERDAVAAERDGERAEKKALAAERDKVVELNDRLRRLLRKAQGFEAKSERLAKLPPDQLQLALEDIEQAIARNEAVEEKMAASGEHRRKINRGALPAHLPHVHETVEPESLSCPCCGEPMHVIGEETAERLDVVPAQYRVIVTHRPKLACRACEKIVEVPAPEHLIKSGLPTEGLVASVLVAKYAWHVPLYRQAKMTGAVFGRSWRR